MSGMIDKAKSKLVDRIESPRDLLTFKLGAALNMEHTVLEMLGNLEAEAQGQDLKGQLSHHADETREQISNLEQAFAALGLDPDQKPCPAIEGIDKEGKANVKLASEDMVDSVILSGAAETEHHEIAVYTGQITFAEALGEHTVSMLLSQNLEQERHTLEEVEQAMQQKAGALARQAA
jgi:ferritin-like metal-binding protein YciE